MDGATFTSLITEVGLPSALAVYLLIRDNKNTERYVQITTTASADSRASTAAIERSSEIIEKSMTVIERNTQAFHSFAAAVNSHNLNLGQEAVIS